MDIATFKMAPHFHDAAEFIADALQTGGRFLAGQTRYVKPKYSLFSGSLYIHLY